MELRFVKMNPSGNTTIIVLTPLPREAYAQTAAKLMEPSGLCAEQVGYVEKAADPRAAARLHMMGGEFCGNAARSFAAWLAFSGTDFIATDRLAPVTFKEGPKKIVIEVSGCDSPLTAVVESTGKENACRVGIDMPLPETIRHGQDEKLGDYTLAVFPGIVHMILWDKAPKESYTQIVRDFLLKEGISDACFGVLFYDTHSGKLYPLISVGAVGSLVWESSCGSGSVAVACAVAEREKKKIDNMELRNPGGDLYVTLQQNGDGSLLRATLAGEIALTAFGTACI